MASAEPQEERCKAWGRGWGRLLGVGRLLQALTAALEAVAPGPGSHTDLGGGSTAQVPPSSSPPALCSLHRGPPSSSYTPAWPSGQPDQGLRGLDSRTHLVPTWSSAIGLAPLNRHICPP